MPGVHTQMHTHTHAHAILRDILSNPLTIEAAQALQCRGVRPSQSKSFLLARKETQDSESSCKRQTREKTMAVPVWGWAAGKDAMVTAGVGLEVQ